MRFVTDQRASEISVLQGRSPGERQQIVEDAATLYEVIGSNEFIDDAQLRQWAEQRGVGPDRFNDALALLRQTDRIVELPDSPALPQVGAPPPPPGPGAPRPPAVDRVHLDLFNADDLKKLASQLDIEGRSKMNRDELRDALAAKAQEAQTEMFAALNDAGLATPHDLLDG